MGAVSYLNTKPMIHGFEKGMMKDDIELVIDYPTNIAAKLVNDDIDVGLVPVAIIPRLKRFEIISDFCIACDGAVGSVCVFSDLPLEEVDTILLDYQSRSSVGLLRILLKEYWQLSPRLVEAAKGYEGCISGTTAGLVIGDRALSQRLHSKYIYDLGDAWKQLTGLPFVFAAWVSNKQLANGFINSFNEANSFGIKHLEEVILEHPFEKYDLHRYYNDNIIFKPQFEKLEIINLFLKKLNTLQ